jgi:chorismate synthase
MNGFGRVFRISIFGESHGESLGITVDGCPAGMGLKVSDFKTDISRRKGGARGTTPRIESDRPRMMSGIFKGKTTGAPLTIAFENKEKSPGEYDQIRHKPRPGHADWVAMQKFSGHNDFRGGGHFS